MGEFEDFGLVSRAHQPQRNLSDLRHPTRFQAQELWPGLHQGLVQRNLFWMVLADFRIRTHELIPPRLRCAPAEPAWYEDGGRSEVLERAKLNAASQVRSLADRVAEPQTKRWSGFASASGAQSFLPSPGSPELSLSAPRSASRNYIDNGGTDRRLEIDFQLRSFRCFRLMPA